MNINTAISAIKEKIAECEKNGDMFNMPPLDGASVKETDVPNVGADLLHREYDVNHENGESIHIDYHSKDKCRTFQVNPDRSVIDVKCSDTTYDFGTAWDEKN